jgi:hypothetical protein
LPGNQAGDPRRADGDTKTASLAGFGLKSDLCLHAYHLSLT